ncbi:unnamed protein product [Calypogeia fissa]
MAGLGCMATAASSSCTVRTAAAASDCAAPCSSSPSCSVFQRSGIGGRVEVRMMMSKGGGLFGYERLLPANYHQHHRRGGVGDGGAGTGEQKGGLGVQAVVKRSPKRLKYAMGGNSRKGTSVVYVQVDPAGSDLWKLDAIVDLIKDGAVGVIPTDTVYAIVCDLKNRNSVDRLYRIKDMDPKKPLSILCRSFQDIDTYTSGFPRGDSHGQTNVFRAAKQCFPGPYTFILPASKEMPKQCTTFGGSAALSCAPRKSVGVRMPNDEICKAILEKLDEPLLCTSVKRPADDEWMLDPVIISDTYGASDGREGLDFVVDGGIRVADPSTVVDMTGAKPVLLRPGKGIVEDWMLMEAHDSSELQEVGGRINPYA